MDNVLANLVVKISGQTAQFNNALKQSQSQFTKFTTGITSAAKGLLVGAGLVAIGKQIISVTAEFQRFEAILTNTLGSNSEAQRALKNIKEFALTTPFEVNEVTAAYVRWANQGLTPTIDKMRKLGDVASSLGAGFEQTAEAFKDLAVGQTKRLEEIGISAEAIRGTNQLRLAFKGVTIEIEKNADGVQKALDVYSQLNGVLGTAESISQTLGGKISNLSDAWTNLMNAFGSSKSGPIQSAISGLTELLNLIGGRIELANLDAIDFAIIKTEKFADAVREAQEAFQGGQGFDKANQIFMDLTKAINETNEDIQEATTLMEGFRSVNAEDSEGFKKQEQNLAILNEELKIYKDLRIQVTKAIEDFQKKAKTVNNKEELTGLNAVRARLQELTKEFNSADLGNSKRLNSISQEITALNTLIKSYEKLLHVNETDLTDTSAVSVIDENNQLIMPPIKAEEFLKSLNGIRVATRETFAEIKKEIIDVGPILGNAISGLAAALGEASVNTEDFGKSLLQVIGNFAQQFGSVLIATGVGTIALESGNPYAMIAGGAILVAAGAALNAVNKKRSNISSEFATGGGSGRVNSDFSNVGNVQDSLQIEVYGVLRGQDIWISGKNYQNGLGFTNTMNG